MAPLYKHASPTIHPNHDNQATFYETHASHNGATAALFIAFAIVLSIIATKYYQELQAKRKQLVKIKKLPDLEAAVEQFKNCVASSSTPEVKNEKEKEKEKERTDSMDVTDVRTLPDAETTTPQINNVVSEDELESVDITDANRTTME